MNKFVHIRKTSLSHITHRLIPLRVGMDYEDDKPLSQNTVAFPKLEFDIFDQIWEEGFVPHH